MFLLIIIFALLSDCFLSALVGILGSGRRIGFGWTFLISLFLTPIVGLIAVLISDPLPGGEKRWGCIGMVFGILGMLCLIAFLMLLLGGSALLML